MLYFSNCYFIEMGGILLEKRAVEELNCLPFEYFLYSSWLFNEVVRATFKIKGL